MKITITLSAGQVQGIKDYLKEVDGIENPTQKDIQREISGIVHSNLQHQHSAVSDYISKYENPDGSNKSKPDGTPIDTNFWKEESEYIK